MNMETVKWILIIVAGTFWLIFMSYMVPYTVVRAIRDGKKSKEV